MILMKSIKKDTENLLQLLRYSNAWNGMLSIKFLPGILFFDKNKMCYN